jgi:heme/copper-type cytochrome/quinol oxidase subunit 4
MTHKSGGMTKYLVTYVCILVIAALQFVVAFSDITPGQMLQRMMFLACVEATLAILFFMHLWMENRGLLWFVGVITIFVLLAMQYGWTDSFRLTNGAPWAK